MSAVGFHKVVGSLPATLAANSLYFVRVGSGVDLYVTNASGTVVAYAPNVPTHTHSISEIANLQASLDAKLDSASYTAADVLAKIKSVDGSGSGLDADRLRNLVPATASTASTLAQRDGSGDISVRLLRSEYATTSATINYIMTQQSTGTSNNYVRPSTPAQLVAALNAAGGIDADTLGGQSVSSFALASRTISAGAGLTGGGSLAANRTISANVSNQATWNAGTATVESVISPAKLKGAVEAFIPSDTGPTANTYARRSADGSCTFLNMYAGQVSVWHGVWERTNDTIFFSSSDNFIRKNTKEGFLASLGISPTVPPYVSSPQTISRAAQIVLAHGLGAVPSIVMLELVCVTADLGYAVGDVAPIAPATATTPITPTTEAYVGVGLALDATSITCRFGSNTNVFHIMGKGNGGQIVPITTNRWKLVVRAYA